MPGHENAQGQAQQVGKRSSQNADDKGVAHFGHARLFGDYIGVVVVKAVGQHLVALPRALQKGGGVQVVRALLRVAGGVQGGPGDIGALAHRHGLQHVLALVYRVGGAQGDGDQILVNIGELVVEIEQILVLGAIAHNGRRELLSPIHRVVSGKGQLPGANVDFIVNGMNGVDGHDAGKITPQPLRQGPVSGGKQLLLAAAGQLSPGGHRVQAHHLKALALIGLCEFLHILRCQLAVVFGFAANGHSLLTGSVVHLALAVQVVHIVLKGDIVQIPVFLPFTHGIHGFLVVIQLMVGIVLLKNQLAAQQRIDQHHDYRHHNDDRDQAEQKSFQQIFCHNNLIYFFIVSSAIFFQ